MSDGKINMPGCFWSSANEMTDNKASEVLRNKFHNEFSDFFSGIGCFEGMFT